MVMGPPHSSEGRRISLQLTRSIFLLEGTPTCVCPSQSRKLTTFSVSNWLFDFQFRDYFRAANSIKITLIAHFACPGHKDIDNCYLVRSLRHKVVKSRKKDYFWPSLGWYRARTTFHLYAPFSPYMQSRSSVFFMILTVNVDLYETSFTNIDWFAFIHEMVKYLSVFLS